MDKTIITALLIIAGVVSAVALYNAVYPAVVQSGDALAGRQRRIDDRLESQIEVIHAVPWGVTDVDTVVVWVKNVGSCHISPVARCDVFFGPEGSYARIPHVDNARGKPYWEAELENLSEWDPTATLKITIDLDYYLTDGQRYYTKVIIPNGVSDDYYFSK